MAGIPSALHLDIVTPEETLVHDDVDEVVVPGEEGYLGVLPGHTPLVATLKQGALWYRKGAERKEVEIAGGFVEVLPDRVTILAEAGASAPKA